MKNAESFSEFVRSTPTVMSTGIRSLDALLGGGLTPGVTTIEGLTGLGKTTLALQIADSIAAGGRYVLYLALEMTRHELMAKSISRMSRDADFSGISYASIVRHTLAASDLRRVDSLLADYNQTVGRRLCVIDANSADLTPSGIDTIVSAVAGTLNRRHGSHLALVVVDYLQHVRKPDADMSDLALANAAMTMFKDLSRALNTCVMVLSSVNRAAYDSLKIREPEKGLGTLTAAFKNSGTIEFESDVCLAMVPVEANVDPVSGIADPTNRITDIYRLKDRVLGQEQIPARISAYIPTGNVSSCQSTGDSKSLQRRH